MSNEREIRAYESALAKCEELIQRLLDALANADHNDECDLWSFSFGEKLIIRDGRKCSCGYDEAIASAEAAGFKPSEP